MPLLAGAMALLVLGLWGGLMRMGWAFPAPIADLGLLHGPLMVGGFLGTLIGLERAVALGRWWSYVSPIGALLGTAAALAGWVLVGALLLLSASFLLVGMFVSFLRRQQEVFLGVMAAAAVFWAVGNAAWLIGAALWEIVPFWMGFLVLTIGGERLELSRIRMASDRPQQEFLGVTSLYAAGIALGVFVPDAGFRMAGAGLAALGGWLMARDIAWDNLRRPGLPRYIGAALLSGYLWLPVSGAIFLWEGALRAGLVYDAALHGVFVGFVMAMIFAHAPIIFPSVLGVDLEWGAHLYGPLVLLQAATAARLVGDLAGMFALRRWGGLFAAVAIVAYLVLLVGGTAWKGLRVGETGCVP